MAVRRKLKKDPRSVATRRASALVVVLGGLGLLFTAFFTVSVIRGRNLAFGMPDPPMAIGELTQVLAAESPTGEPTVLDLPVYVRVLSALPSVIDAAVLFVAALLLARLLLQIAQRRAFSTQARQALSRLSLTLIFGSLLSVVADTLAVWQINTAVAALAAGTEWPWTVFGIDTPRIPIFPIALGLVAAALLYALKDGAALEREAEGVI